MLNVAMLSVVMPSVVKLNVAMRSVVAPFNSSNNFQSTLIFAKGRCPTPADSTSLVKIRLGRRFKKGVDVQNKSNLLLKITF